MLATRSPDYTSHKSHTSASRKQSSAHILISEFSGRAEMPESRLFDRSSGEFKGRVRLVCIGLVRRGVAAKMVHELVLFLARELFVVKMPSYLEKNRATKLKELRWRFPSTTSTSSSWPTPSRSRREGLHGNICSRCYRSPR